ncbi:MAG: DUF488 family protein [Dehalococcoidia bacterium]
MTSAPPIQLGSVFAPPEAVSRLLVSRHWPRSVARGAIDQWEPQLAPAPDLVDALANGAIDRDAFAAAYRAQLLARPNLLDWAARMAAGTGVALLCEGYPLDGAPLGARAEATPAAGPAGGCHCDVLAALLRERIG